MLVGKHTHVVVGGNSGVVCASCQLLLFAFLQNLCAVCCNSL